MKSYTSELNWNGMQSHKFLKQKRHLFSKDNIQELDKIEPYKLPERKHFNQKYGVPIIEKKYKKTIIENPLASYNPIEPSNALATKISQVPFQKSYKPYFLMRIQSAQTKRSKVHDFYVQLKTLEQEKQNKKQLEPIKKYQSNYKSGVTRPQTAMSTLALKSVNYENYDKVIKQQNRDKQAVASKIEYQKDKKYVEDLDNWSKQIKLQKTARNNIQNY